MSATSRPGVTVVIPTHNRREAVVRLLRALAVGTLAADRFDVVVVADGCSDDTVAALGQERFPFRLAILEQNPGRGPATARNAGARLATGDILVFIDDDIEPLPTLLEEHVIRHAAGGATVLIGAPIPIRRPDADLHEIAMWGWWEQQFEAMRVPGHRFTYGEMFGGVMSVGADLFHRSGGFDEAFNGCREDPELGYRLLRLGASVGFSREAGGFHHELRDRRQLLERKRAEGRADLLMARVHPELWETLRIAGTPATSLGLRFLHRLAFDWPAFGDVLLRLSGWLLDGLERLRWRGTWRKLHAATMYYAYWRGAAGDLGGGAAARAELARLAAAGRAARDEWRPREVEVDLAGGLAAAEARLDQSRPDSLRILLGGVVVGVVAARPGAEALAGRHLRHQVFDWLAGPLGLALSVRALQAKASPRPAPALELVAGG